MSVDYVADRLQLVEEFRGGDGATEIIAAKAIFVLGRTWPRALEDLARDELLAELLQNSPVFQVWIERRMTAVRRYFLFSVPSQVTAPLLGRLAIQCHLNEYAWAEDAIETQLVQQFSESLDDLTPEQVMTLACYRPLARIPGADALLAKGWTGPVEQVLREQVTAVREEEAIAAEIESLTPVRAGVSAAVRSQYEANPYPRWRRAGSRSIMTHIRGRPLPADLSLLVAGCGTGKHPIEATLILGCQRTLAVDLSRTSLAYAVRKTRELGLSERITYAQADLLELGDSGLSFDMVQSAGVLHHMDDPFEGARQICKLLKPGGFIALGLYSAMARAHLQPAKTLGKTYTAETVREFRQTIIDASEDDPIRGPAVASRDFYATSGCRDLLMHVQEHQLRISDLRRMLDENGLVFLGFHQFEQAHVRDAYRAMFPHDPNGVDLTAWDAFEALHPSTFARMYQFWAMKSA